MWGSKDVDGRRGWELPQKLFPELWRTLYIRSLRRDLPELLFAILMSSELLSLLMAGMKGSTCFWWLLELKLDDCRALSLPCRAESCSF